MQPIRIIKIAECLSAQEMPVPTQEKFTSRRPWEIDGRQPRTPVSGRSCHCRSLPKAGIPFARVRMAWPG